MLDANNPFRWKTKAKEWKQLQIQMKPIVEIISSNQYNHPAIIYTCIGYCFATESCGLPLSEEAAKNFFELAIEDGDITAYLIYAYFLLKGKNPFKTDY